MNRTRTIALFAGIFAIAMTTYGLSGVSASPMIMASMFPQTQEVGILGHVEFTVFDSNDNIKAYVQSDNVVVESGKDCAGRLLFGAGTENSSKCTSSSAGNPFTFIGIGNGTIPSEDVGDTQLAGGKCAATGGGAASGELARKVVVPITAVTASASAGTEIILDVGTLNTFKFEANNATSTNTITQSALFNGDNGRDATTGECLSYGTPGTNWEMFSIKDLSSPNGIQVNSGDSLAVKWTITLGGP